MLVVSHNWFSGNLKFLVSYYLLKKSRKIAFLIQVLMKFDPWTLVPKISIAGVYRGCISYQNHSIFLTGLVKNEIMYLGIACRYILIMLCSKMSFPVNPFSARGSNTNHVICKKFIKSPLNCFSLGHQEL